MTNESRFGELRSLLQGDRDAKSWRERVLKLVDREREEEPARFRDEWVPYLAEFPEAWRTPLHVAKSVTGLQYRHEEYPWPCVGLHLEDPVAFEALETALDAPCAQSLSALELAGVLHPGDVGGAVTRLLASHPRTPQLQHLKLRGCSLGDEGARALAASKSLSGLVSLDVRDNGIRLDGMKALASSPHLSGLEVLILGQVRSDWTRRHEYEGNLLGDHIATVISQGPWTKLRHLNMNNRSFTYEDDANMTSDGLIALASSPTLSNLTRLELHEHRICAKGVRALCSSEHITSLAQLDLGSNRLGPVGGEALAGAPSMAGLEVLDLMSTDLGPRGVAAIADSPHLERLQRLDLSFNEMMDEGAMALARSENFSNLTYLHLHDHLEEEGLYALGEARTIPATILKSCMGDLWHLYEDEWE